MYKVTAMMNLFISIRAQKVDFNGIICPFGLRCKENDIIGVLLEFVNEKGKLKFYKNGVCSIDFN